MRGLSILDLIGLLSAANAKGPTNMGELRLGRARRSVWRGHCYQARSKYRPHQGKRECTRRLRMVA